MKFFRVLSCVVYSFIDNYIWIEYLGCQSKKLSVISFDQIFDFISYNELLGIGIPDVLMNLISCHGFIKDTNSTVVILYRTPLVEYYLAKVFVILEHNSTELSIVPNEVKQIMHAIDMHDSEYVMSCYTSITYVANTVKKLHIMSDLNYGHIHNFYRDKQESNDDIFFNTLNPY